MHYTVFGTQPVIRELQPGQWSSSLRSSQVGQYTNILFVIRGYLQYFQAQLRLHTFK